MYMSGAVIGMAFIQPVLLQTPLERLLAGSAFFGVVTGTTTPGTVGRRTGTTTFTATRAAAWGFGLFSSQVSN